MNVLSLFDGASCGRVALERTGLPVDKYYASEVDKYAIKVAQHNYPDNIQLGDIQNIIYRDGILHTDNGEFEAGEIDMLIGGSPCTNFSFAGKQKGMSTKEGYEILDLETYLDFKEKGFEFEGQSYLFWEYVRLMKEINPKYFLLENVKMAAKWKGLLSKIIGVSPVLINSSLLTAQNRERLYWCNWEVEQPEDKGIVLKDVLEDRYGSYEEGYLSVDINNYLKLLSKVYGSDNLTDARLSWLKGVNGFKTFKKGYTRLNGIKAACLTARSDGSWNSNYILLRNNVRTLTPIEYERLQTLPDNYTSCVSDTQRYKMIGNGWSIDVIAHIFKNIPKDTT